MTHAYIGTKQCKLFGTTDTYQCPTTGKRWINYSQEGPRLRCPQCGEQFDSRTTELDAELKAAHAGGKTEDAEIPF